MTFDHDRMLQSARGTLSIVAAPSFAYWDGRAGAAAA